MWYHIWTLPYGILKLKIDIPDFIDTLKLNTHDIIFLSECWFSSNTKIDINGFTCYKKALKRRKRAKRDSGGICVLFKNSIANYFELIDWNNEDGMLFKLSKNNVCVGKDIYFFYCYMRSENSTRNDLLNDIDVFDALTNKICDLRVNNEIVVIGDLKFKVWHFERFSL